MGAAAWVVARRRRVALAWLLAAVLFAPAATRLGERLDAGTRVRGSESERVERILRERFASPFTQTALLVARGLPPLSAPEGRAALARIVDTVAAVPGVRATHSLLNGGDPLFLPREPGATFVLVGLDPAETAPDALVRELRARSTALAASLGPASAPPTLRWTGAAPLALDLRHASAQDARRSELRALPLTLVLLLLAFGSVAAAALPLLAGVAAVAITLGVSALAAQLWDLSILLENIVSILGLALGIDYALLMVGRFREGLAAGASADAAAAQAAHHAGHTILLSGATVAVGFAALLLVDVDELRSVAFGGLVVVLVAVLFATTLLPGVLAAIGARVDALRVWRRRRPAPGGTAWRAWGGWVVRHPGRVLLLAGVPLLLLAVPALRLSTAVPRTEWLPRELESARALADLRILERAGIASTLRVVLELPPGTTAADPEATAAIAALTRRMVADARVAEVQSLPRLAARFMADPARFRALVPDSIRLRFESGDGRMLLLEVVPREAPSVSELARLVDTLRATTPSALGLPAGRVLVGGLPAYQADYERAVARAFPWVIALVLGGTFIALLIGFRSLLVPLKATLLNLLSVGAAYGALVLVFQDGHGAALLGLDRPLDGVFPAVPILVFCVVFGLSMDYEVFLVSRVGEARRHGAVDEGAAITEGLVRTGGVITSAAAIMVAIFLAFALGSYMPAKLLGFALAVAVALDATLVRMAIGPALLRLAGHWNWWPGDRGTRAAPAPPSPGTGAPPPRGRARDETASGGGSK